CHGRSPEPSCLLVEHAPRACACPCRAGPRDFTPRTRRSCVTAADTGRLDADTDNPRSATRLLWRPPPPVDDRPSGRAPGPSPCYAETTCRTVLTCCTMLTYRAMITDCAMIMCRLCIPAAPPPAAAVSHHVRCSIDYIRTSVRCRRGAPRHAGRTSAARGAL